MANVQYPEGHGAPAQAALPLSQGIQPADELAAHGAQADSGQVAQVVQNVGKLTGCRTRSSGNSTSRGTSTSTSCGTSPTQRA